MLGDDALVMSHRLQEWVGRAPELEEETTLANIGLDLLGQARLLLARACQVDGSGRSEDDYAFGRDVAEFRNVRLVEGSDADFGTLTVRLLVPRRVAAGVARPAAWPSRPDAGGDRREGRQGTDLPPRLRRAVGRPTGRRHTPVVERAQGGVDAVEPFVDELFEPTDVERRLAEDGVAVDPAALRGEVEDVLHQVLATATLHRPAHITSGRSGRDGPRTEAMYRARGGAAVRGPRPPGRDVVTDLLGSSATYAIPNCRCSPSPTWACCVASASTAGCASRSRRPIRAARRSRDPRRRRRRLHASASTTSRCAGPQPAVDDRHHRRGRRRSLADNGIAPPGPAPRRAGPVPLTVGRRGSRGGVPGLRFGGHRAAVAVRLDGLQGTVPVPCVRRTVRAPRRSDGDERSRRCELRLPSDRLCDDAVAVTFDARRGRHADEFRSGRASRSPFVGARRPRRTTLLLGLCAGRGAAAHRRARGRRRRGLGLAGARRAARDTVEVAPAERDRSPPTCRSRATARADRRRVGCHAAAVDRRLAAAQSGPGHAGLRQPAHRLGDVRRRARRPQGPHPSRLQLVHVLSRESREVELSSAAASTGIGWPGWSGVRGDPPSTTGGCAAHSARRSARRAAQPRRRGGAGAPRAVLRRGLAPRPPASRRAPPARHRSPSCSTAGRHHRSRPRRSDPRRRAGFAPTCRSPARAACAVPAGPRSSGEVRMRRNFASRTTRSRRASSSPARRCRCRTRSPSTTTA